MQDNRTPARPLRPGLAFLLLIPALGACGNPDRRDDNQRTENTKEWGNETQEDVKTQTGGG